jgi:hypothetical protein
MSIHKTKVFSRWARKEGLGDRALCAAVAEMAAGLYEADLGGNLLKKRIARRGHGERDGFRTLVATNKDDRWFFVYGFAKNERSNIEVKDEVALKLLAATLLAMTTIALDSTNIADELIEVNCDGQETN